MCSKSIFATFNLIEDQAPLLNQETIDQFLSDCQIVISFGFPNLSVCLLAGNNHQESQLWLIGLYSSSRTVNSDRLSSAHLVIGWKDDNIRTFKYGSSLIGIKNFLSKNFHSYYSRNSDFISCSHFGKFHFENFFLVKIINSTYFPTQILLFNQLDVSL